MIEFIAVLGSMLLFFLSNHLLNLLRKNYRTEFFKIKFYITESAKFAHQTRSLLSFDKVCLPQLSFGLVAFKACDFQIMNFKNLSFAPLNLRVSRLKILLVDIRRIDLKLYFYDCQLKLLQIYGFLTL